MNILLFNSSADETSAAAKSSSWDDVNCRLFKSSAARPPPTFENFKLKPIEQIRQQLAFNQYTVNNFEKFFMLKIKCKCIHILNRLVSLVRIYFSICNFKFRPN